ncbi:hypothetical protein [Nocardioides marinquilinus]|uniref:hypothetical protein n=1 Tax=Nocardioides marinquilinus TaxID=1210400 RepID=UPI0031EFEAA1
MALPAAAVLATVVTLGGCSTLDEDDDGVENGSVARAHEAAVRTLAAALLLRVRPDGEGRLLTDEGRFAACHLSNTQYLVSTTVTGWSVTGTARGDAQTEQVRAVLRDLGLEVTDGRRPGSLVGVSPDVEGLAVSVSAATARDDLPDETVHDRPRYVRVSSDCVGYSDADDAYAGRD